MTDIDPAIKTLIDHDRDISEQFISLEEALAICVELGHTLKGVKQQDRDAAIFRLQNKFKHRRNEGITVADMMFGHVAKGWKQASK